MKVVLENGPFFAIGPRMQNAQKLGFVSIALASSLFLLPGRQSLALERTAPVGRPMAVTPIDTAVISRDKAGKNTTNTLKPTDNPFYCRVRLNGPGNGTKIKAAWIAVSAGGKKNFLVASKELVAPGNLNIATFTFSLPRNLPTGLYRTNIYLNGKLTRAISWIVK